MTRIIKRLVVTLSVALSIVGAAAGAAAASDGDQTATPPGYVATDDVTDWG